MKCRVCGCNDIEKRIKIKEMMMGTRRVFDYFECANCHAMQIENIPENLGDYYGSSYYSFAERKVDCSVPIANMEPVLDVGCGSGEFLLGLRKIGFGNLYGCDPYIDKEISYGDEIRILKKTVHEIDGKFKYIFLNDSFEHVTDPHETFESLSRLLDDKGVLRISIPIFPNIAYDMYEASWFQFDAPRHIILHSRKSMKYMAKEHGFKIMKVEYNSTRDQFAWSYYYSKNMSMNEVSKDMVKKDFTKEDLNELEEMAKKANLEEYGDHAAFILMKNNFERNDFSDYLISIT